MESPFVYESRHFISKVRNSNYVIVRRESPDDRLYAFHEYTMRNIVEPGTSLRVSWSGLSCTKI